MAGEEGDQIVRIQVEVERLSAIKPGSNPSSDRRLRHPPAAWILSFSGSHAERPYPMKTDESVDLVSDPMIAREVLDIHKKLMRNPLFRVRFSLALAWQRIWDWLLGRAS